MTATYETAEGMRKARLIDAKIMREFDKDCLTPVSDLTPSEVNETRFKTGVSQTVLPIISMYPLQMGTR